MSAVPEAPRVSFQPLSSALPAPGSANSRQCGQQDNWHHEQDDERYTHHLRTGAEKCHPTLGSREERHG